MNWWNIIKQKSNLLQVIEESMTMFKNNPKWQKYDSFYPNDAKILHDLIINDNNWQQTIDNKYEALGPILKLIGKTAIKGRAFPPDFRENTYFTPTEIKNIKTMDRRKGPRLSGQFSPEY